MSITRSFITEFRLGSGEAIEESTTKAGQAKWSIRVESVTPEPIAGPGSPLVDRKRVGFMTLLSESLAEEVQRGAEEFGLPLSTKHLPECFQVSVVYRDSLTPPADAPEPEKLLRRYPQASPLAGELITTPSGAPIYRRTYCVQPGELTDAIIQHKVLSREQQEEQAAKLAAKSQS